MLKIPPNSTSSRLIWQPKRVRTAGFTLVEIMIVVVIIVMLSQVGNIASLFRQRENSQTEEIAVQLLGMIDAEKTDALLGNTFVDNDKAIHIVRKRVIMISSDTTKNSLSFESKINLAKNAEENLEIGNAHTWTYPDLEASWHTCPSATPAITETTFGLIFEDDTVSFTSGETPAVFTTSPHIVLLIQRKDSKQELHIDRRTGLTYVQTGNETISCP